MRQQLWLVSFMHYDLGFFDHQADRLECAPNPFGANLLPMLRNEMGTMSPGGTEKFVVGGTIVHSSALDFIDVEMR